MGAVIHPPRRVPVRSRSIGLCLLTVSTDWDAQTYDQIADPQTRWGAAVAERLSLAGDERVLDAGCGSGRVTALLLPRLTRGHVIALDASPAMIARGRSAIAISRISS